MTMTFEDYSIDAVSTAQYAGKNTTAGLTYALLGVANEAGEACGPLKKYLRGDKDLGFALGGINDKCRDMIADELGDVLWYLDAAARELGLSLEAIALRNLQKLADRKARGVISGSGDKR